MGLLSFIGSLLGYDQEEGPAPKKDVSPTLQKTPQRYSTLVIEGDDQSTVYTYDGDPLKGTRKGSVFYVTVYPGDMTLCSRATDYVCNSMEMGVPVLCRNGIPFGTGSGSLAILKEIAMQGVTVKVKAKRLGMYMPGIPEVKLMTPPHRDVRRWVWAREFFQREMAFDEYENDYVSFNIDGEDWPTELTQTICHDVLDFAIEHLPVRKGSQAKPHILLSVNGVAIKELSARDQMYRTLDHMMPRGVRQAGYERVKSKYGEGYFWSIRIWFNPEGNARFLAAEQRKSEVHPDPRREDLREAV